MNTSVNEPPGEGAELNPMADSWEPADKAIKAAIESPQEFDANHPTIEDSLGPVPSGKTKTHGEAQGITRQDAGRMRDQAKSRKKVWWQASASEST